MSRKLSITPPQRTGKIRLVLVDDHDLVRGGLKTYLVERFPAEFEVIGEAKTGYKALSLCLQLEPDIVVLDLNMPGDMNGYELIPQLRKLPFSLGIIVLTGAGYSEDQCMRLGADYWVDKNNTNDHIKRVIELVANNLTLKSDVEKKPADLSYRDYPYLLSQNHPPAQSISPSTATTATTLLSPLSPKQLEVLSLAAQGFSIAQIAAKQAISPGTVKAHLNQIYTKLNVHSITGAVLFAKRNRLFVTNNSESYDQYS